MSPKIITDNVFKHRKEIGSDDLNDLIVDGGTDKVKKALIEKWKCEPEGLMAVPSLTVNSAGKLSGAKWYTMGIIPKEISIKVNQLHISEESSKREYSTYICTFNMVEECYLKHNRLITITITVALVSTHGHLHLPLL